MPHLGGHLGYDFAGGVGPPVPSFASPVTSGLGTPIAQSDFGAPLDQFVDPVTLDYVRTATGEWQETADSRSTVLIMFSIELGASPFDPGDGTRIAAMMRSGDPITPDFLQADALRAGRLLVQAGIISDLTVQVRNAAGTPYTDESGRQLIVTSWRDLASGSPIDQILKVR